MIEEYSRLINALETALAKVTAERDDLRKQVAALDNDIRTERAVAERLIQEGVKRGNMFERGEMASSPSGTFYPATVELQLTPNGPLHSDSEFKEMKEKLERAVQLLDQANADKGHLSEAILTTLSPEVYTKVFELYHGLRGTYNNVAPRR